MSVVAFAFIGFLTAVGVDRGLVVVRSQRRLLHFLSGSSRPGKLVLLLLVVGFDRLVRAEGGH